MSILSALAHHGRRRLRPPPFGFQSSSPLVAELGENSQDDEDDGKSLGSNQGRRLSLQRSYLGGDYLSVMHHQNYASSQPVATGTRQYHATTRREILPLIAVGFVGATAVYTYKALQQIDRDWEEYYDELEEYKARTGIDPEKQQHGAAGTTSDKANADASSAAPNSEDMSSFFTGGTLAIDMGTTRLKLSHRSSIANRSLYKNGKPPSPMMSVDREGFRSTPSLAWMPPTEGEEILIGRMAEARSYDTKGGCVLHLREALENNLGTAVIQQTVRAAATNALDQVLGSSGGSSLSPKNPLFVLDASVSNQGSYNVRPIFTYPAQWEGQGRCLERYQQFMNGLTSPAGIAAFVPEPVAIMSGAEYHNLLPSKNSSAGTSVLVVDVGGTSTSVSMVGGDDEVLHSASLPFGGDTFIDCLVSHLVEDFYSHDKENTSGASKTTSLTSKPDLNDSTALQRLYEASTTAIHELSNKTRSDINIPYLTMDLKTRQPKHLKVGMARTVVDAKVETWVQTKLVPYLQNTNTHPTAALSQALPPPTGLSTLFSSTIMSSLEQTSHTPHMLRAILLVGGGARIPLVRRALLEGVVYLAGDAYASGRGGGEERRLIMLEGEMADELGVLGATAWGSGGR